MISETNQTAIQAAQHGGGLVFVALERSHRRGKPGGIGEQPDGDLRA
jgi:hypothetical protein